MRRLNRAAIVVAATSALALAAPAVSLAGQDASGAWCYQRSWWDPRWPDCPVNFVFQANGEYVRVEDGLSDGHSAVLKIWAGGVRKANLWASGGLGSQGSRNMGIPDGTKMQFQMCTGEWRDDPSDRYLVSCQDKVYTGTA
jgi:hypothetical protein